MESQLPPFTIDLLRCSGCGCCLAACRAHLISLETSGRKKTARLPAPQLCHRCRACLQSCPLQIISDP